jgi:hypothetical protein
LLRWKIAHADGPLAYALPSHRERGAWDISLAAAGQYPSRGDSSLSASATLMPLRAA